MTRLKPRTARVTVYDGEDLARLAELGAAVERAERADRVQRKPFDDEVDRLESQLKSAERAAEGGVRLLTQDDPVAAARAELEAAQAARDGFVGLADAAKVAHDGFAVEAEARGVLVVMIARQRLRWRELMKTHGPRDENAEDAVFGVNMETLPDVLLPESVDAGMSTIEGDVGQFLEELSDYDYYDRLFVTAFALNRGSAVADPTRRLLSGSSQTSTGTSSSPSAAASLLSQPS